MQQRLVFFAWYLVSVQSAYESFVAERGRSKVWTDFDPRVNMIDAGTGLLEAPVSNAEAKRVKRPAAARGKTPTSAPAPENRVHPKPVRAGKPKVTKDVAEPQAKNPPARKPPVTAPAARKTKAKPSVG